ncbi:hypothetical protein HanPSC8_Chr04g0140831 [Helianthus annuus]|nr:hypothetical protein HanPSC8_Chr04g0140831 [Helianthus annuus]
MSAFPLLKTKQQQPNPISPTNKKAVTESQTNYKFVAYIHIYFLLSYPDLIWSVRFSKLICPTRDINVIYNVL